MNIVEIEGLAKSFGKIVALNGLDMHIPRGVSGFIGPNGAGKTTTINILAGLVKPTKGTATIFGLDIRSESLEIRRRVRFMLENMYLPGHLSVEKYMKHVACLCNSTFKEVIEVLEIVGLKRFKYRPIKSLSAGMMQRLRLAQVLLGNPELIVLDEPTANLDPIGKIEILEKIAELNREKSINFLISSHILPELERIIDWVSIINDGRIIAEGRLSDIIPRKKYNIFRIFSSDNKKLVNILKSQGYSIEFKGSYVKVEAENHWEFYKTLSSLINYGIYIYRVEAVGTSLNEVFRKMVKK